MELIKITEITNQLGVSSRSLRYYEQVGLIQSVRLDFEKYRFYDQENIERLKQIIILRKMQIPIKDIIRIYESENMSIVVSVFIDKINSIDDEINNLSELKGIVNEFLQTMLAHGVKKITAIPILYEEMNKRMENSKRTVKELIDISQRVSKQPDIRLIELSPMRVLSSYTKKSGGTQSDAESFWQYINECDITIGAYGSHDMFEYQDLDNRQTVILLRVSHDFLNDSPYIDQMFEGGLFAACCAYVDEDIFAIQNTIINNFNENLYYQIDYLHDGNLRHEILLESILSPDDTRERVELFIPIKKRVPDVTLFEKEQQIDDITLEEIQCQHVILKRYDVELKDITPIFNPRYEINSEGEGEYTSWISQRVLDTNIKVKIPFRVDITFKTKDASVRLYHGKAAVMINTGNVFDLGETMEALEIKEPVFGAWKAVKYKGSIKKNEYNTMTWIADERYFSVIVNDEVRYCGTGHPYMRLDIHRLEEQPIIIGSNSSEVLVIKSVNVSQLHPLKPRRIPGGEMMLSNRLSNNVLPGLRKYMTNYLGQNYALDGCMSFLMECLGEDKDAFDYWFFSGLTGDNLTQVYCFDYFVNCFCLSAVADRDYIKELFDACGYENTYVSSNERKADREKYTCMLTEYIDKGIPVITRIGSQHSPTSDTYYALICGYEDYGKELLYLFDNSTEPEKIDDEGSAAGDWIFVGKKKKSIDIPGIYRKVVMDIPKLIKKQKIYNCTFGAQAFYDWADDIENGRFDNASPDDFDQWKNHATYVCMLATNASCPEFLERALQYNPDIGFLPDVISCYKQMKGLCEELEAVGGGFNVTLEGLKDKVQRRKIADKIREFAKCYEEILNCFDQ